MTTRSRKVLWREGLFLTPQHFQAAERRSEWLTWSLVRMIHELGWGVYRFEIEEEAIANWQFQLRTVKAIMQDGTLVECPEVDPPPASRSFKDLLAPGTQSLDVYLALTREDLGRPGVSDESRVHQEPARCTRVVESLNDYVVGGRPREVEFVSWRPEIRFSGEPVDRFDLLPVARLQLLGTGQPALDRSFLPPCLSLTASTTWTERVSQTLAQVQSMAKQLRNKLTYRSNQVVIGPADTFTYMATRELMAALPGLQHCFRHPDTHPFVFFQQVAGLYAALGSLVRSAEFDVCEDLPAYDHAAPGASWLVLHQRLQGMFDTLGKEEMNVVPAVLREGRTDLWTCSLATQLLTGTEELYLWAQAALPERDMLERFPGTARLAAPQRIDKLITYNVPGVKIEVPVNVPMQLPAPQQGHYFKVDTRDELWAEVLEARELVIQAPGTMFPELLMRLHIVPR